ncbi:hypothetical protein EF405_13740 [Cyclobacteriaceae bacterium YHN15]|nr:hypothetical protein EF405_13740 [Cyclobacteriaceae bacterium YHN15]
MSHSAVIYEQGELPLINPFEFNIDPMERLLLVNIENDLDTTYKGFEPQYFNDEINGKGLLVIAWRLDMKVDLYYEKGLTLNPAKYDIAGNGLCTMKEVKFEKDKFQISEAGVQADIVFEDHQNRRIEIKVIENHHKPRKPFGLLVPMGDAASHPSAMPLVYLHDFYFVRRNKTDAYLKIDGKQHKIDKFPFPLDGTWMYFMRYSPDTFIVTFNPSKSGVLTEKVKGERDLKLQANRNAKEIKSMIRKRDDHQVELSFDPPFPQVNLLKEGVDVEGTFEIHAHISTGKITGKYWVKKNQEKVNILLQPIGGWQPNEKKMAIRLLYAVAKIFKHWPKTYLWSAQISQDGDNWQMVSKWERI